MKSIRWRLITIAMLAVLSVIALVPRYTTQRIYDPATGRMRDSSVLRVPINLGLDLRGGIHLGLEIDPARATVADCTDAIKRAERVIRTRLDEFGTSEPVVHVVNDCRLIVELPGVYETARAKDIVQRSAFLEFRLTRSSDQFVIALPGLDSLLLRGRVPGEFLVREKHVAYAEQLLAAPQTQRAIPRDVELKWSSQIITDRGVDFRGLYALDKLAIITGEELRKATAVINPESGGAEVQFELTNVGARRFGDATGRNIGGHLAILLDGRVQGQPPVIRDRIAQSGRIELGGRSLQEANDLALLLRAGALPAPLHIVEEAMVGPSLGADSIRDGVRASLLAVAFVLVVLVGYYGIAGLLAVGALALYVLFSAGGLAALGYTLSLPGLAGFALSIGMAVDANVLIFERMREELAAGKTVRTAVNEGFAHAMSAIIDSNVTTALTAAILYMVGTESVRGFAATLLIGIIASMLSAVFVTRTFFLVWVQRRQSMSTLHSFKLQLFANAKYGFIRVRRWAYAATLALIVPGLATLAFRGPAYSIEFTGGTMLQIRTDQPATTELLRGAFAAGGLPGAEIQTYGSERDFLIRARLSADNIGTSAGVAAAARSALDRSIGDANYQIERSEGVQPKVGAELRQKALIAVLLSFLTTLIYLAFRFEWRFGLAAVIATAHDVLASIAFIGVLDLEVSLVVVAALLTVLGYSLNDTIVIFDRVRENMRASRRTGFSDLLDRSINETLPRTVLTGGTTLAAALVLSFFAGEVIKPFALVMSFGIVIGTFSSIYVAAPVLLWIERRRSNPQRAQQADSGVLARARME